MRKEQCPTCGTELEIMPGVDGPFDGPMPKGVMRAPAEPMTFVSEEWLSDLNAQVERLTKERDELAASNARLREALVNAPEGGVCVCGCAPDHCDGHLFVDARQYYVDDVLAETPAQSVAHYKAEGFLMAADVCEQAAADWGDGNLRDLAELLKAKAKGMKG